MTKPTQTMYHWKWNILICEIHFKFWGNILISWFTPCIMCVQYIGGYHEYIGGYHEYIGGIPWVHWGIPWVHRGDTMSTLGGYHEYIGGISWVHRGMFSTSEGYHEYIGGCSVHRRDTWVHRGDIMSTLGDVQYIRGISWYMWGDTMSTSGRYHEYIGGISWVHWGMFSTSGGYHDTYGGYHEYIGGISWVHRGISWVHWGDIMSTLGNVQYIRVFNRNWKDFIKLLPHMYHDIPWMYWTFPDVLMISPWCTEHPLMYSWYPPTFIMISPDVLNIPRCTHDIPQCTHGIPLMYWTPPPPPPPPDVLNTHYTGWLSNFGQIKALQLCLEAGFLLTNWLVWEQQMLRDVGFSVFCQFNSKPT